MNTVSRCICHLFSTFSRGNWQLSMVPHTILIDNEGKANRSKLSRLLSVIFPVKTAIDMAKRWPLFLTIQRIFSWFPPTFVTMVTALTLHCSQSQIKLSGKPLKNWTRKAWMCLKRRNRCKSGLHIWTRQKILFVGKNPSPSCLPSWQKAHWNGTWSSSNMIRVRNVYINVTVLWVMPAPSLRHSSLNGGSKTYSKELNQRKKCKCKYNCID